MARCVLLRGGAPQEPYRPPAFEVHCPLSETLRLPARIVSLWCLRRALRIRGTNKAGKGENLFNLFNGEGSLSC